MGSTCGKSRAISFAENVRAFLKVWRFRRCFSAFGEKKPLPYTRKNASAPSCLQGKLRDCGLFCTPERMHPNHPLKSRSLLFSLVKTLFLVDGNKMQIRNDINEYGSLLATLNQYLRYSMQSLSQAAPLHQSLKKTAKGTICPLQNLERKLERKHTRRDLFQHRNCELKQNMESIFYRMFKVHSKVTFQSHSIEHVRLMLNQAW